MKLSSVNHAIIGYKTKKLYVLSLIWLLTFLSLAVLAKPVVAEETWTDITTLPYTISSSGNYRIAAPITGSIAGSKTGLTIMANDVVLDGQNNTIALGKTNNVVVVKYSTNVLVKNMNITAGLVGFSFGHSRNVTLQNSNTNGTWSYGLYAVNTSFVAQNSSFDYAINHAGVYATESSDFIIKNSTMTGNYYAGVYIDDSSGFQVSSCNSSFTESGNGLFVEYSGNFTVDNVNLNNNGWNGVSVDSADNYTFTNSVSEDNFMAAFWGGFGRNITVQDSVFSNNSQAVYLTNTDDVKFDNNQFSSNGVTLGAYWGGFQGYNTNATLTNNAFDNNYDAIMWEVDDESIQTNQTFIGNTFQNNSYTFFFAYTLSTLEGSQKIFFSNNLVNDTAYVDPEGLSDTYTGSYLPFNNTIFNFNSTLQLETRTYSNGPLVAGNFWAHPDGSGYSQTGIDADSDGFVDAPFELFGNESVGLAYDYHPYSLGFDINTWVPITLPATITQPGNYRITSPYSGNAGLIIQAHNVTVDGQNYPISNGIDNEDSESAIFLESASSILLLNINISNSNVGIGARFSSNFTVKDSALNNNFVGLATVNSIDFTLENVTANSNFIGMRLLRSSNFTLSNCNSSSNIDGGAIQVIGSDNFTIQNATLNDNEADYAMLILQSSNFLLKNSNLKNNPYDAITISGTINFTITKTTLNYNGWGAEIFDSVDGTIQDSLLSHNIQGIFMEYNDNVIVAGNTFSHNGLGEDTYYGGFEGVDSNVTVVNNLFSGNLDALMWSTWDPETVSQLTFTRNVFQNNNYTFFFYTALPSNITNQKFFFYNNLVNDTAYVDPACLSSDYSGDYLPFNQTNFRFNTTLQADSRIYSSPSILGGNYWASPNGTGYSQTAADLNHDGFIDSPFELFGNATIGAVYDYLPYSSSYVQNLVFISGASQSLAANQMSAPVTVSFQDAYGTLTSGITINLLSNSTTGKFYSDKAGANQISSITIPAGSSTGTFYYNDSAAGSPMLTALAEGVTSSATQFSIAPHASTIEYITISPQTAKVAAGQTTSYQTTAYDLYGNNWNVSATYMIDGSPLNGNTVTAYLPSIYIVEAAFNDKTVQTTLEVTAGPVNRFAVIVPTSAEKNIPFDVMVVALDVVGNVVTDFEGTVSLRTNQTSINPTTSGEFTNGIWTGTATISEIGVFTVTASDGNGHFGTSKALTVNTPAPTQTPTPTPNPNSIHTVTNGGLIVELAINGNITSSQISGATITVNQSAATTTISFTITGQSGTIGFGNITIPKSQVPYGTVPTVNIDGRSAQNQGYSEDGENFYVWYTTHFSSHKVEIQFTRSTQPTQDLTVWYILIAAVAAVVLAFAVFVSRKKRIRIQQPIVS